MPLSHIDLHSTCTQAEFGDLVGMSQQATSDLLVRGVLSPGATAGQWLLAYTTHLREQAASRGADSELAFQRSELARVGRERAEIKLAEARREYAPVVLIEQVLAHVGRSISDVLEPVPDDIARQCPRMTAADLQLLRRWVDQARQIASTASLEVLAVADEAPDGQPDPDADELVDGPTDEGADP